MWKEAKIRTGELEDFIALNFSHSLIDIKEMFLCLNLAY